MGRAIAVFAAGYLPHPSFSLVPKPLAAFIRNLARDLFDDYRPELHYMRGPGPAWRKKHGQP